MDEIIATFIASGTSLTLGTDIFIDETCAERPNYILVRVMHSTTQFTGIKAFDVTVIICDLVYDTARSRANTINNLFNEQRGIGGSSWGTIGNVESRYEGTDTMRRTIFSVLCKIGKQED